MQQCLPKHSTPDPCSGTSTGTGNKIDDFAQCAMKDKVKGITLLKYFNPPDWNYPDEVSISNVTSTDFSPVNSKGVIENGKFVVQFKGSISVPPVLKHETGNGNHQEEEKHKPDQLQICVNQASYIFRAAR